MYHRNYKHIQLHQQYLQKQALTTKIIYNSTGLPKLKQMTTPNIIRTQVYKKPEYRLFLSGFFSLLCLLRSTLFP